MLVSMIFLIRLPFLFEWSPPSFLSRTKKTTPPPTLNPHMQHARLWLSVLLLLVGTVLMCARASMIQDIDVVTCTTDACCRAMYLSGVTTMPWCAADIVSDAQEGGCHVVPRCALSETCLEAAHECVNASRMATIISTASCDASACNRCNGQQCNVTSGMCDRVADPVVCTEGTQCHSFDPRCNVQSCSADIDCTSDGIFCNGVPRCNSSGLCAIVQPCKSIAPMCSEAFQKCNAICVSDVDCALPAQTFCDTYRVCDAEADFCLRDALPRCNPANQTCDPINKICDLAPPAGVPAPLPPSLVNGNVLAKWVLIIWLFTFVGGVLCVVIVWLSQKPRRGRANSTTSTAMVKPVANNRRK